jgi:S-adenosylmethionine:tRNA ribosyltransferase-isomerase
MTDPDFALASYDYALPPGRIAQVPLAARDASRLMLLDRVTGRREHRHFSDLPELLRPGDLLVTNRSRVFKARLVGRRPGGGRAELLLVRLRPDGLWDAMLRPGRRLRAGTFVEFAPGFRARIEPVPGRAREESGAVATEASSNVAPTTLRPVRLLVEGMDLEAALERHGHTPLPPYIKREDQAADRERYQTVYAREPGSVAAPTAGLHFTPELFARLDARGVERAELVLHVGPGTFRPVQVQDVRLHRVEPEPVLIPEAAALALERARAEGRRVVAVGTTVARALESGLDARGRIRTGERETDLVIVPGHRFQVVSALVTNFHLPRSSLLLLVCAFAGRASLLDAYREAIEQGYRFYSYGDATLIA